MDLNDNNHKRGYMKGMNDTVGSILFFGCIILAFFGGYCLGRECQKADYEDERYRQIQKRKQSRRRQHDDDWLTDPDWWKSEIPHRDRL